MIVIKEIIELEKYEEMMKKSLLKNNSFQSSYKNIYALHKSNNTVITFIDDDFSLITSMKRKNVGVYECCNELEPLISLKENKTDKFIEYIYNYLNADVLYFPLVYSNSEFYKNNKDNKKYIIYKRLYSSLVELNKKDKIIENIKNSRYYSKKKIKIFERDLDIKYITMQDVESFLKYIEKNSWKNSVGQDMTTKTEQLTYYNELIKLGIASLILVTNKINKEPVAYRIDTLIANKMFQLKTSFNEKYKKYSPGAYLLLKDMIEHYDNNIIIDLFGGPNLLKNVIETNQINRYDFCYGEEKIIKELQNQRKRWDKKNFENFKENKGIRKIYKRENV